MNSPKYVLARAVLLWMKSHEVCCIRIPREVVYPYWLSVFGLSVECLSRLAYCLLTGENDGTVNIVYRTLMPTSHYLLIQEEMRQEIEHQQTLFE